MIETLKNVSTDPNIIILKRDKSNGVVVLNKEDYVYKMNPIIKDSSKFTRIGDDCFKRILKRDDQINIYLYKLLQHKTIGKLLV